MDSARMLYTLEEINAWKQSLIKAGYGKDISATIHHGICQGDPNCCSDPKYNDGTVFSLSGLTPEKALESLNMWARFEKWLDESAAWLCLLVLVLEDCKMAAYILTFLQNL